MFLTRDFSHQREFAEFPFFPSKRTTIDTIFLSTYGLSCSTKKKKHNQSNTKTSMTMMLSASSKSLFRRLYHQQRSSSSLTRRSLVPSASASVATIADHHQKMSIHSASSEYAACFQNLPIPDVPKIRESAVTYVDNFDSKKWYDKPVSTNICYWRQGHIFVVVG